MHREKDTKRKYTKDIHLSNSIWNINCHVHISMVMADYGEWESHAMYLEVRTKYASWRVMWNKNDFINKMTLAMLSKAAGNRMIRWDQRAKGWDLSYTFMVLALVFVLSQVLAHLSLGKQAGDCKIGYWRRLCTAAGSQLGPSSHPAWGNLYWLPPGRFLNRKLSTPPWLGGKVMCLSSRITRD